MSIKEKISYFKQRPFVKDVAILQSGTMVSTFLSLIASIVFTRSLGVNDYGLYVLIFAFTSLIGTILHFGNDYTVLTKLPEYYQKKNQEGIKNLLTYYITIDIVVFFTLGLATIAIAPLLSTIFYHNQKIGQLAQLVILSNFLNSPFSLLSIVLQATRKIKYLTILENSNKILFIVIPVALVIFGGGLFGLIVGYLLSAISFFIFAVIAYHLLSRRNSLLPSWGEIIKPLFRIKMGYYFRFGFSVAIDKNIRVIYNSLPLNFLGAFAPAAQLAYFKIAFSYVSLNNTFLTPISRLLTVQLPKSKTFGLKTLQRDFIRSSIGAFLLSLLSVAGLVVIAPWLITFFYGQDFAPSIKLVYFLGIYASLSALGVGLGPIFRTVNKMKVSIYINSVVSLVGMFIAYYLISNYLVWGYVIFLIIWNTLQMMILYGYVYKKIFFQASADTKLN